MSEEVVGAFLEHLDGDEALRLELQTRIRDATAQVVAGFAAERGFEFTPSQLADVVAGQADELTDDELESVAGGGIVIIERTPRSARDLISQTLNPGALPGAKPWK